MLLHGSVIKYHLNKVISCIYKAYSLDIEVGLPLFYEEDMNLSGHIVLIETSQSVQIVRKYENVIFVCHNNYLDSVLNSENNIIIINENVPITRVFNEIMGIFLKFNNWETTMVNNISNFATFDKLFKDLELIVDQGVFLADTQFHFVAYTKKFLHEFPDLDIYQAQSMMVKPGFSSLDSVKEVFQYSVIEHCLHKNIFFHNSYVGRLGTWYSEDEDKNIFYTHILNYLAKYLEDLYSISGSFERATGSIQHLKKVLRDYINGIAVDMYTLSTTLKENHYHLNDEYFLINFTTNINEESYLYANYIGMQMERKWQGICCVQKESSTLILLNITVFNKFEGIDFFQQLSYLIRDSMLIGSISRKFCEMQNVYYAYKQTKIAFEYGKKFNPSFWLYKYDQYVFDYLLQSAKGDFSPQQVSSFIILKLLEYDEKNNTQYNLTLFEYIKHQYNASATAKTLYIARSTFLSRMEQIIKLTGVDLGDWNIRLYLMLSYKLFDMDR